MSTSKAIPTLLALSSASMIIGIGQLNGVTGQSDVTLTCPQTWYSGQTVTLYCEVVKASVSSKCGAARNITGFSLDQNGGTYGGVCSVLPEDFSSCNYVLGSKPLPDCGCQGNTTHYIFVHQFIANGTLHNGNWDCTKICTTSPVVENPLTKYINPNCRFAQVRERPSVTVTGQSDVTVTCPQTWHSGKTVTLYCEVVKASISSKCARVINSTYFNIADQKSGIYGEVCAVNSEDYSNCNHVLGRKPLPDCGCQGNATHYIFVLQVVADRSLHNGNWECIKSCATANNVSNPLTHYINPNCKLVHVIAGGAGKLSRLVLVLTCCIGCLTSLGIWPGVCPCY